VEGYFNDGHINISLKGKCEIEPQRLFSPLGHNALEFTFFSDTKGVSVSITSHLAGIVIEIGFHLLPTPRFYFRIQVLENNHADYV
jgi:hypothetical protein